MTMLLERRRRTETGTYVVCLDCLSSPIDTPTGNLCRCGALLQVTRIGEPLIVDMARRRTAEVRA